MINSSPPGTRRQIRGRSPSGQVHAEETVDTLAGWGMMIMDIGGLPGFFTEKIIRRPERHGNDDHGSPGPLKVFYRGLFEGRAG
jgi:hypothetical protein